MLQVERTPTNYDFDFGVVIELVARFDDNQKLDFSVGNEAVSNIVLLLLLRKYTNQHVRNEM